MIISKFSTALKSSSSVVGRISSLVAFAVVATSAQNAIAADRNICNPGDGTTGAFRGTWYSYYEASSQNDRSNCDVFMRIYDDRNSNHFRIEWDQNESWNEDTVGGVGWEKGSDTRKIGYNIGQFESNASQKAIAGVYGWTCGSSNKSRYPNTPAQEYYIVDTWSGGGNFVPWDENASEPAKPLRKNGKDILISSNGGEYKIYKVKRNGAQFCGDGSPREFDQFWSVRTSSLSTGKNRGIDFANHDNVWDDHGFRSYRVKNGYQIVMGEAFGHANFRHIGIIDASAWSR